MTELDALKLLLAAAYRNGEVEIVKILTRECFERMAGAKQTTERKS